MCQIIIWGMASKTNILVKQINSFEKRENSLSWLQKEKIPIASSCSGEGLCKKCIVNTNSLSCQTVLIDYWNEEMNSIIINIAYL